MANRAELSRERMAKLVRIYHTPQFAAEATGCTPIAIIRSAKKFGLHFRATARRYHIAD